MTTPHIKFENSPVESLADSFISTPGTSYPSLFNEMDNNQAMTPQSYNDEDSMFGGSVNGSISGTPAPEKKPVKKRKSWGQQLPEPKTNLPPRKRAKTEDEKEQRRVERVLRNRRAAQSSRERKRQEVEALEAEKQAVERQNQDLLMRLADAEARCAAYQAELERVGGNSSMAVFRGSSAPSPASPEHNEQFRQTQPPITFSQDLFGSSKEADNRPISTQSLAEPQPKTVNPASLSPEIRAVDESTNASSSDMTQHPAVSIGGAPALDEFDSHLAFSGNELLHHNDLRGYFEHPQPSESDNLFFENGIAPVLDQFNLDFDHMAGNNDSYADDLTFDDFINHDDQPSTEIQSVD
jgi:transcriptional activator HAC1